jgi:hypothetical protein
MAQHKKSAGGEAQGIDAEFKLQYHRQNKKLQNITSQVNLTDIFRTINSNKAECFSFICMYVCVCVCVYIYINIYIYKYILIYKIY